MVGIDVKKCSVCEKSKFNDDFPKIGLQCKVCKAAKLREYRSKNKEHVADTRKKHRVSNKDRINKQRRERYASAKRKIPDYLKNPQQSPLFFIRWLLRNLKKRLKCDIDFPFVWSVFELQRGKCVLTGILMTHKYGDPTAISIDRIDADKGYVKGNIQLICQSMNLAKGKRTNPEFQDFLDEMIKVRMQG